MRLDGVVRFGRRLRACGLASLTLAAAITAPTTARADNNFEAVPTSWRLQQYGSNGAVAFFTASTCAQGMVTVPTTYNADDISRFWATVLTARALGRVIGVYYDPGTPQCYITSYYLKEQ